MKKCAFTLMLVLLMTGCERQDQAESNTVSREDIIDFCDSAASDSDLADGDKEIALMFAGTDEQAQALVRGASLGRLSVAVSGLNQAADQFMDESGSEITPFAQACRRKVREQLAKLEKSGE